MRFEREPTAPTVEERYTEPLPPTPFIDRYTAPSFPWMRVVMIAVLVELVMRIVLR